MSSISDKFVNILLLNYEYPPIGGGASNATYYMLKEYSKNMNIKIDVITSSVSSFEIIDFSSNIKIHRLDIGKNGNLHFQSNKELLIYSWKVYWYIKKLIKKNTYNLIHAFFGIPCGYIAMKTRLPYIVSLRGSDVPFYNKRFEKLDKLIFKRLSKKIWKNSKAVIANSEGLKELALKTSSKQDIKVIYNGVDIDEFLPIKKNKIGNKIILISTGRLIPRKGYKYLIEALKGIDNCKLQLIGGGVLKEQLKKLANENKVKVEFLGNIKHENIHKYLQKADIFVLPSLNEGMSNSILEAMSCGLPIIATDVGGSKELINGNGFVVSKANIEELKETILKYFYDKALIIKHGKNSRKLAENMSWNKIADSYYKVYSECVE